MPRDGCLDQPLTFGWNGGFVAFTDVITISPCRTFVVERMVGRGGGSDTMCRNEIAENASITADAIDAALAEPMVQAAFASAPTLFGTDSRPVDGAVYSIELGGATIEVGGECGSGGGLGGTRGAARAVVGADEPTAFPGSARSGAGVRGGFARTKRAAAAAGDTFTGVGACEGASTDSAAKARATERL